MSCVDVQDSLVEYLVGELDPQGRASVEMHLSTGCSQCQAELQALNASVDVLWQALPNNKLSKEFQRAIVARAVSSTPPSQHAALPSQHAARSSVKSQLPFHSLSICGRLFHNPLAQSFIAFAAGILFMIYMKPAARVAGSLIANRPVISMAASSVNLASPRIPASLEMSEKRYERTQLVALRGKPGSSELGGYVLCDALTREIHVFCHGLQQPPSGSQYVLWLNGPGIDFRAVDRLEVDSAGICKAAVRWPEGDFRVVKVTLEISSKLNSKPSNDVELTSYAFKALTY